MDTQSQKLRNPLEGQKPKLKDNDKITFFSECKD